MERIVRIGSISQLHELMGYGKPKHPLITIIDYSKIKPTLQTAGLDIITDFYSISIKEGKNCAAKCGRQFYDFQESCGSRGCSQRNLDTRIWKSYNMNTFTK